MPPILNCTFAAEDLSLTEVNMVLLAEEWVLHMIFSKVQMELNFF